MPQIKLPKNARERAAEEVAGLAGLLLVIAVVGGLVAVDTGVFHLAMPLDMTRWAVPIGLGALAFGVFAALAITQALRLHREGAALRASQTFALREAAFYGARDALKQRRISEGIPLRENLAHGTAAPLPVSRAVTPREAEEIAAQWMRHLGEEAAATTRFRGDGGLDVVGARFAAQVKHYSSNVGVAAIRELAGAAAVANRRALFFTSTGYSPGAVSFADRSGVALFIYNTRRGELRAVNSIAVALAASGLG